MKKKSKTISMVIRMTEDERRAIDIMARACGEWSASEFVRELIAEKRQELFNQDERKEV